MVEQFIITALKLKTSKAILNFLFHYFLLFHVIYFLRKFSRLQDILSKTLMFNELLMKSGLN